MEIYLFVAGYLAFFSLIQMFGEATIKGLSKYFYAVICILLFLIAGFRYGLETDYWHYRDIFNNTSKQVVEPGFLFLISTVRLFTKNYNIFLIIVAALSIGIKAKVMGKFKCCLLIMFTYYLRFYVLFELNGIRQGLSLAIVLMALLKLMNGEKKKFIILSLIASTIHMSSVLILFALILDKKELKPTILIRQAEAHLR